MAIIEIAPGQTTGNSKGIAKTIDKSSEKMIFNVLQNTMYSYPVESTVRETASNMIDAIKEKSIAIEILTSKAKVSDYFVERVGDEYNDSKFKADYYDIKYLNTEDKTKITYKEVDGFGFCDSIIFEDTGVGLSPERFIKAVGLAFSTKRNTTKAIGGWGLGLKSPIATEVDYFTIESSWNGKKIIANCSKYKTDFLIPKLNTETGKENPKVNVEVGDNTYVLHYEEYAGTNYTKITIPSKRINRSKYKDAVENQLMYFPQVTFEIVEEDGDIDKIAFKANVLYNSKNIILSDNRYYSKPHIVIVKSEDDTEGVNYGMVDYRELELEQQYGSVGIKCLIRSVVTDENGVETILQEGLSVTPSREKVIFNETTKKYLLEKLKKVSYEASNIVQEQLKETDFIVWLKKANEILMRSDSSSVLGRMSAVIDKKDISPLFADSKIRFKQNPSLLFAENGVNVRVNNKRFDYKTKKETIERLEITDWSHMRWDNIYWQEGDTSHVKDIYISTAIVNGYSFMTIRETDLDKFLESISAKVPDGVDPVTFAVAAKSMETKRVNERTEILKYLKESKLIKSYDDVEVPEDWKKKLEEVEQKADEDTNFTALSPVERRKLEQKIVVHTPRKDTKLDDYLSKDKYYTLDKREEKGVDFINEENVYYADGDSTDLLHIAACMLDRTYRIKAYGYNNPIEERTYYKEDFKLVMVSSMVANKYCKNHTKINNLFYNLKNDGTMSSSKQIIQWYTAKLVKETLDKYPYWVGFKLVNNDIYKLFEDLNSYSNNYYEDKNQWQDKSYYKAKFEEVFGYLEKIKDLQLFVVDHKDNQEAIAEKSTELFGSDMVKDGNVIDIDIYNKLQQVIEYSEPLKDMLNNIQPLFDNDTITDGLEREIRLYIDTKGLTDFKIKKECQQLETTEVLELEESL